MSQKFQNKYRVDSIRLRGYDYRNEGAYFLTICTQNRECYFGECINGSMYLTKAGEIAHQYWDEIPDHFPNSSLGAFIIMPDHMHGIIILDHLSTIISNPPISPVQTLHATSPQSPQSPQYPDSLGLMESPTEPLSESIIEIIGKTPSKLTSEFYQNISPKAGAISTIIRSYKSAVSKFSRVKNPKFGWQSSFHDHIIRNQSEYERIQYYILNNPRKWSMGK